MHLSIIKSFNSSTWIGGLTHWHPTTLFANAVWFSQNCSSFFSVPKFCQCMSWSVIGWSSIVAIGRGQLPVSKSLLFVLPRLEITSWKTWNVYVCLFYSLSTHCAHSISTFGNCISGFSWIEGCLNIVSRWGKCMEGAHWSDWGRSFTCITRISKSVFDASLLNWVGNYIFKRRICLIQCGKSTSSWLQGCLSAAVI